ncbi:MAG: shikimate dehydrogenase [Oscillospiraceae bacterium]|jgi:shikimate 5-dehydrogenase|nr:shikimate dehydrogenase [Oscillospiraceae bacterium]
MKLPEKATKPTMYFIGVTTGKSSILKVFPGWAKAMNLGDVSNIVGIDMQIHAPAEQYRTVLEFIRDDPMSLGALVTTHKIDMYNACEDMFDYLDPYALTFGELSSISKDGGKLLGHAKDPISSGKSMDEFIPPDYWIGDDKYVCILGAGGSALAIAAYLSHEKWGDNVPRRINLVNRSAPRLAEAVKRLSNLKVPLSFHLCPNIELNDRIVRNMPRGSMVVNATGLGKDRPGSPLTDDCLFPEDALVWEINYRGSLEFMHQAIKQQKERNLLVEDGWSYFIHGWTEVVAEVFHIDLTDDMLEKCREIAESCK